MTLDTVLHTLAKLAVRLHCLPVADIRHVYVWKACAVAYARVNGQPQITEKMVDDWCFWEARYVAAGYRPFSLIILELFARGQQTLHPEVHHSRLFRGEQVILHARRFRHNFLEGASP